MSALLSAPTAAQTGDVLLAKLIDLGAPCELAQIVEGPSFIRYELRPVGGTLMSKIRRTADDLAYATGAWPASVIAPLPGRAGMVGIELPCAERRTIRLGELPPPIEPLSFPLGQDVDGEAIFCDLTACPHLLIAGETGSGKSSMVNAMLCSLLSRFGPDLLALVLIDPKRVELPPYAGLPHLLAPVADTVELALSRLYSLVEMMELRYDVASQVGARSLPEVNVKLLEAGLEALPYVVCVVDELADLMMTSRKEAESLIVRLAQKSRAVGIHLVLATQSPRVTVVTGMIKTNVPSRICFSVPSMTDSRVVLDRNSAEKLLGKGDGLLSMCGGPLQRFQGALVSSEEITAICDRWR